MRFASVPALEAARDFAERGCHRFVERDLSHFLTKAAVGKTVHQKKKTHFDKSHSAFKIRKSQRNLFLRRTVLFFFYIVFERTRASLIFINTFNEQ